MTEGGQATGRYPKAATGGMPRTIRQTRTSPAARPRRLQRTSRMGSE
jgi:hypothetical protein